jgi:RimJ/RimL family protein N-acetyltransferase
VDSANQPSQRVLEKAGFRRAAPLGGLLQFERGR